MRRARARSGSWHDSRQQAAGAQAAIPRAGASGALRFTRADHKDGEDVVVGGLWLGGGQVEHVLQFFRRNRRRCPIRCGRRYSIRKAKIAAPWGHPLFHCGREFAATPENDVKAVVHRDARTII